MNQQVFETNLTALQKRDPVLSGLVRESENDGSYSSCSTSKTGRDVPLFKDGSALHSLQDPVREAKRLLESVPDESFVFFAGLAGGFQVREFLERFPGSSCLVAEASLESLKSLLGIIDVSDIILNRRVRLAVYSSPEQFRRTLADSYLPAIHGGFVVLSPRSWSSKFPLSFTPDIVRDALSRISEDYSVQAHFGRLWLRNIMENLITASGESRIIPAFDTQKRAIIAAAGPSLENSIHELKDKRDRYIIISTDTAWGTLSGNDLVPDVVVSIDAQQVSSCQALRPFRRGMTLILDVCGNPAIARKAVTEGVNVIFTSGGHPLARYASEFGSLPSLDTSSGTVTQAAQGAALALGFSKPETIGADYAYVNGKPYARGTYLADIFDSRSSRIDTSETGYVSIIFRSPVLTVKGSPGITYRTAVMDRYRESASSIVRPSIWKTGTIEPFPVREFFPEYRMSISDLTRLDDYSLFPSDDHERVFNTLIPFIAWYRKTHPGEGQNTVNNAIHLAFSLIAVYTVLS